MNQRLYFYAKFTDSSLEALPQPHDPLDMRHVSMAVAGAQLFREGFMDSPGQMVRKTEHRHVNLPF